MCCPVTNKLLLDRQKVYYPWKGRVGVSRKMLISTPMRSPYSFLAVKAVTWLSSRYAMAVKPSRTALTSLSRSGGTVGCALVTVRGLRVVKVMSSCIAPSSGVAPASRAFRAMADRHAARADPWLWMMWPLMTFMLPWGIGWPSTRKWITGGV